MFKKRINHKQPKLSETTKVKTPNKQNAFEQQELFDQQELIQEQKTFLEEVNYPNFTLEDFIAIKQGTFNLTEEEKKELQRFFYTNIIHTSYSNFINDIAFSIYFKKQIPASENKEQDKEELKKLFYENYALSHYPGYDNLIDLELKSRGKKFNPYYYSAEDGLHGITEETLYYTQQREIERNGGTYREIVERTIGGPKNSISYLQNNLPQLIYDGFITQKTTSNEAFYDITDFLYEEEKYKYGNAKGGLTFVNKLFNTLFKTHRTELNSVKKVDALFKYLKEHYPQQIDHYVKNLILGDIATAQTNAFEQFKNYAKKDTQNITLDYEFSEKSDKNGTKYIQLEAKLQRIEKQPNLTLEK